MTAVKKIPIIQLRHSIGSCSYTVVWRLQCPPPGTQVLLVLGCSHLQSTSSLKCATLAQGHQVGLCYCLFHYGWNTSWGSCEDCTLKIEVTGDSDCMGTGSCKASLISISMLSFLSVSQPLFRALHWYITLLDYFKTNKSAWTQSWCHSVEQRRYTRPTPRNLCKMNGGAVYLSGSVCFRKRTPGTNNGFQIVWQGGRLRAEQSTTVSSTKY